MAVSQTNYLVHTLLRARDWQHRPEFDQVCDWWRDGGRGVCALVGMGGAGKTAIADRFLNELLDDTSTTRERVSPPHGVFVYSFYDDDKPENFFRHLQIWLEGDSAPDKQKSPTQLMFDIQQHQGLIILDGLEKVQESGARGGFGRLISPGLRDLLNHIACGSARELSVLVTSRFPLTDLRDSQPRFFHTIAVDQIDVAAGIALLRARGVRGTDAQLAPIVEHCGLHALTLDLAGGYIKEYGHGDPATPLNLGTAEELEAQAEQELDDDRRAVLKQGIRFARIAQRYREAMLESDDEAALALLERICLFRLGVDCETLAAIFTGPDAAEVSGKALAGLNADQLQKKLAWLVRMRIVEQSESSSSLSTLDSRPSTLYSIHPAVRDGFLSGISREAAQVSHEAVRNVLEVSLGDAPGNNVSDPATLDLLEEIIFHAISSGHPDEAWDIYQNEIGAYRNLGWRLGDFERGQRICRSFQCQTFPSIDMQPVLPDVTQRKAAIHQWGLYLSHLGQLTAADICFHVAGERMESALVLFRLGRLAEAKEKCLANRRDVRARLEATPVSQSHESYIAELGVVAFSNIAHVEAQLGNIRHALECFSKAENYESARAWRSLSSIYGLWEADLFSRIGRLENAWKLTNENKRHTEEAFGECDFEGTNILLADLDRLRRMVSEARTRLEENYGWAVDHDAKEELCWSALVRARLELSVLHDQSSTASAVSGFPESALTSRVSPTDPAHPGDHRSDTVAGEETRAEQLAAASIAEGLKIARDCGYGLFHIDLLLERARLHLYRGSPQSALDDIEVALDTGIPANEETGQVELLAANHQQCGYAWALPAGLQLRAEALLLQAAQTLGQDSYAPAKISELPADVIQLIDQAEQHLHEALDLWQPLHDPEPESPDQNFQLDGKQYNYKAAEAHRILTDLEGGVLTQYPLEAITEKEQTVTTPVRENAFISYSHVDAEWRDALVKNLKPLVRTGTVTAWSDQQIKPGSQWYDEIQRALAATKVGVFLVTADFLASDFIWKEELKPLLEEADKGNVTILWVPVKASLVEATDLPKYQALGNPDKPLNGMTEAERDQAWVKICKTIRDALNA